MSLQFLTSFASLIELIGDLIPKRLRVAPFFVGVKAKGMTKIVVLREGCHWYWPFRSEVQMHFVGQSVLALSHQYCITKDGRTVMIDGSVQIEFFKSDSAIIRAFVKTDSVETLLCSKGMAAVCDLISRTDFSDLGDRDDFNERLTDSMKSAFGKLGVKVHGATIETLATGTELLHIGSIH